MPTDPISKDFVDDKLQQLEGRFQKVAKNKYKVAQYSYPVGIGVDDDKQHYMAFFINVRGKSKFNRARDPKTGFQEILDDVKVGSGQNRLDPNRTSQQIDAAFITTAAGASGITKVISDIGKGEVSINTLKEAGKNALFGAIGGAVASKLV